MFLTICLYCGPTDTCLSTDERQCTVVCAWELLKEASPSEKTPHVTAPAMKTDITSEVSN